jgi:ATP-dependent Clp protease ATP-binding subunit ClpX
LKVIGQEEAKRAVSIAISNHTVKLTNPDQVRTKDNLLIIGPTGSGKTEIARALSEHTDTPIVVVDSSHYTPSGYVGQAISSALKQLVDKYGIRVAETGVIVFDEFDKLVSSDGETGIFKSQAVQSETLRMVEGGEILVRDEVAGDFVIDTTNILFIFAGAFGALGGIVNKKTLPTLGMTPGVGQEESSEPLSKKTTTAHLVKFGFMPELLGRISKVVFTEALVSEDLVKIMKSGNSLLSSYRYILNQHMADIEFTEELLKVVADESLASGLGVRGLKSPLDKRLESVFFNVEDYKLKAITFGVGGVESTTDIAPVIKFARVSKRGKTRRSKGMSKAA